MVHCEHAVQFYESDAELAAAVVPFLAAGASADDALVVIANDLHRREFAVGLQAEGVDIASASADGSFLSLDAAATLAALMPDGKLDAGVFDEIIGGLLRRAAEQRSGIHAYGEMVALLWNAGDVVAAIGLERLWNELAHELDFSLFCAYPAASVDGHDDRDALHEVCELHSRVVPSASAASNGAGEVDMDFEPAHDAPARARRFVRATLRRWGQSGMVVDGATTVTNELATNAVVHAGAPFSVVIRATGGQLRISVSDAAPDSGASWKVRPRHGLSIVSALCDEWGVAQTPEGKAVWAELPLGVGALNGAGHAPAHQRMK